MSIQHVDPNRVRWFHVLPPLLGLSALLWLIDLTLPKLVFAQRPYWGVVWVLALACGLSGIASFVCHRRTGFGAPLAMWLYWIWGKDKTPGREAAKAGEPLRAHVGSTGLAAADAIVLGVVGVGVGWSWWSTGGGVNIAWAGPLVLAGIGLGCLALLPGVPSLDLARWELVPVLTDNPRTKQLIEQFEARIPDPEEVLRRLRSRHPLRPNTPQAAGSEQTVASDGYLRRRYQVKMLRTPVALGDHTFSADPQVIATESFELEIDSQRLEGLRDKNRSRPLAFHESLNDHIIHSRSDEVFILCTILEALCRRHRLSPWDRLQTILAFCQSPNIEYAHDDSPESQRDLGGTIAGDYCRYPLETLADQRGDCDCHCVLAATLFYTLGYECCIFLMDTQDPRSLHMALGVAPPGRNVVVPGSAAITLRGKRYLFCETTGAWHVGRIPEDMDRQSLRICWPKER